MATDKARFERILADAEREMDTLFGQLATEIGQIVLGAAGDDGTVPVERLQGVLEQVNAAVDRVFLGGAAQRPYGERNEPLAPFPRIISRGQYAQIDLVLERHVRILDKLLPADVRDGITRRWRAGTR